MILWLGFAGRDALGDRRTTFLPVAVAVGAGDPSADLCRLGRAASARSGVQMGPVMIR